MKKGIYYITQKVLFEVLDRLLNLFFYKDQSSSLSLVKISFSSDFISASFSSMRMCCLCTMC